MLIEVIGHFALKIFLAEFDYFLVGSLGHTRVAFNKPIPRKRCAKGQDKPSSDT